MTQVLGAAAILDHLVKGHNLPTTALFIDVLAGVGCCGKAPHAQRVLIEPAAAVQHHSHWSNGTLVSQRRPERAVSHIKEMVEKALATLTSYVIAMEAPAVGAIQTTPRAKAHEIPAHVIIEACLGFQNLQLYVLVAVFKKRCTARSRAGCGRTAKKAIVSASKPPCSAEAKK